MADNVNSEIIGGIGITLTGDYSSLQSSYAAAQVQAQQAGTAVADAFNTGVASVSDAAQVVSGSLSSIEPAAAGAAGSLQQFSGAAQSAGDAAQNSESSLASLGAQLTAIPLPGHTRRSVVYLWNDSVLFAGDSLAWDRVHERPTAFRDACWYSWSELKRSLARLTAYRFEWLLPGHGHSAHRSVEEMRSGVAALVERM